jgi:hypothetical protein
MEQLPDGWVAVNAPAAFQFLTRQPAHTGCWVAVRRPLFVAFILACDISLVAADPFNPRLVASAAMYWAFVPFSETLALALVCWNARGKAPMSTSIDLFFAGHAPWLLWFTAISIAWSFQAPHNATAFMFTHIAALVGGSAVVSIWSGCIDFHFFRVVMGRSRTGAMLTLLIQRAVSWLVILFIFSWASLSAELTQRLAS